MSNMPGKAPTKVVVLGASNLSLGWPRLVRQLSSSLDGPLDVYTAHGMGRSYCGERSGFVFWQLPGILSCGIWEALAATQTHDVALAVLTDLGNDLVYGKSPEQVADAARESILRLREWNPECRIVMTRPPVDAVNKVGWLRFIICRLILFPKCPLNLAEAKVATAELAERLIQLADEMKVEFFTPPAEWYGLDPIHVRRKFQSAAFQKMIDHWRVSHSSADTSATSKSAAPTIRRPKPQSGWVFGRKRLVDQPAVSADQFNVFAY